MFLDHKISHCPKQVSREKNSPLLNVWMSWIKTWRGTKFPMWSNITTGSFKKGKAQMEAPKRNIPSKGWWRVSAHWIHSERPAQWQTFFHRVLHEMYPNPHYAYSGGIIMYCACVCVRARERTRLINHWNPPRQSLTNRQHSRLVPQSRIWAKCLN